MAIKPGPTITSVLTRSGRDGGVENAWISVTAIGKKHPIMLMTFSAKECNGEAWIRAVKHGKEFADRLEVPFRKKRGKS